MKCLQLIARVRHIEAFIYRRKIGNDVTRTNIVIAYDLPSNVKLRIGVYHSPDCTLGV
jgi:hypothetical protein